MAAENGKSIRMKRMFDETGTCLIFAGCHHMTSKTIYAGQRDVCKVVNDVIKGGATCINIGKGFVRQCMPAIQGHVAVLNYVPVYPAFSKVNPYEMVVTTTVEEALINGADGIVLPVDFYSEEAAQAMSQVAEFVRECDHYGMVFVVEAEFPSFYDKNENNIAKYGAEYLKFAGRVCSEVGVDVISTNYTGDPESFSDLVDFVKIPVLINGGTVVPQREFLKMVEIVRQAGARGCLIGRNISETESPERTMRAIGDIFRKKISAEQAFSRLAEKSRT